MPKADSRWPNAVKTLETDGEHGLAVYADCDLGACLFDLHSQLITQRHLLASAVIDVGNFTGQSATLSQLSDYLAWTECGLNEEQRSHVITDANIIVQEDHQVHSIILLLSERRHTKRQYHPMTEVAVSLGGPKLPNNGNEVACGLEVGKFHWPINLAPYIVGIELDGVPATTLGVQKLSIKNEAGREYRRKDFSRFPTAFHRGEWGTPQKTAELFDAWMLQDLTREMFRGVAFLEDGDESRVYPNGLPVHVTLLQ